MKRKKKLMTTDEAVARLLRTDENFRRLKERLDSLRARDAERQRREAS
jgi:tetrahydromethanopterin S-methyltransferase subunit G